jgi:two-component system sensor histidine kinase/response regulator
LLTDRDLMPADPALLLVDDRPENLLALEAVLAPLGRRILLASSGAEALRHLLVDDIAVIILDVQMPGLDGFETAQEIKRRERSRDIPIVFLTAINQEESHRLRGFATGAVDYIFKPVDPELLRAKVRVFFELRVATTELELRTADLERSNADLEQFAYVASHDLQEPLRVIAGYLELLTDRVEEHLDDTERDWIGRIRRSCEHMSELITDLLAYSRAGAGTREAKPVDLDAAAAVALGNLAGAPADSGAIVRCDDLGRALGVSSDITQVFQNLIGNALKYRGEEPPRVDVSAVHAPDMVTVAVRDNGRGVPEEDLQRVFGMFERVEGEPYPGTGLGLAVCRRVVERAGGRIWMEPNEDAGVTVRFTLPVVRPT